MIDSVCQIPQGTPVLVTGATGFTGIVLTRKLVEAGLQVSAVARESSNLDPLKDLDIKWFRGDVFDEKIMQEAVAGQEYIFFMQLQPFGKLKARKRTTGMFMSVVRRLLLKRP